MDGAEVDQSTSGASTPVPSDRQFIPSKRKTAPDSSYLGDARSVCPAPALVPVTSQQLQNSSSDVPRFYHTRGHPVNRSGFRYCPCTKTSSSSSNAHAYREIEFQPEGTALFSWQDRSQYAAISADARFISTDRGFRAARANVPLRQGSSYFEVSIIRGGGDHGAHVRLGVGRRQSPLNAPVGFDGYSYGLRDKTGQRLHLSQPRPYGPSFGSGDTIGVLLVLPNLSPTLHKHHSLYDDDSRESQLQNPSRIVRKRIPIQYKGQLYFESLEYSPEKEMIELADTAIDPSRQSMSSSSTLSTNSSSAPAPAPGSPTRNTSSSTFSTSPSTTKKKGTSRQKHTNSSSPSNPSKHSDGNNNNNKTNDTSPPRPLPTLKNSKLFFFKNGELMNESPAFEDLFDYLPLKHHSNATRTQQSKKQSQPQTQTHQQQHNQLDPHQQQQQQKQQQQQSTLVPPSSNPTMTSTNNMYNYNDRENYNDDGSLGYYPFASVYGGAIAKLNPGPVFEYPIKPPPGIPKPKALSERYEEYIKEITELDDIDVQLALLQATAEEENGITTTTTTNNNNNNDIDNNNEEGSVHSNLSKIPRKLEDMSNANSPHNVESTEDGIEETGIKENDVNEERTKENHQEIKGTNGDNRHEQPLTTTIEVDKTQDYS